jgi:hypothetical protein
LSDCEVTISWGNESTCGILSYQSEKWLGGVLQLNDLAELAEPAVACDPLDNPVEPNVASPLPEEGFSWVAGPYSPPDLQGQRVRTVKCMAPDGAVVNDTLCIDPTIPEEEVWRPADTTTSLPLMGKIALIARGVCTFINKGSPEGGEAIADIALAPVSLSGWRAIGQMAELAGATAALVINMNPPEPGQSGHLRSWADGSQIGIPLIVIPLIAGGSLKAAVKANPALRVSIRTHAWVAEGALELESVASVSLSAASHLRLQAWTTRRAGVRRTGPAAVRRFHTRGAAITSTKATFRGASLPAGPSARPLRRRC